MISLKRTVLYQMTLLCALLLLPFSAFAAGTISVVRAGENVFNVVASGLDAPAGFQLYITYDRSRLSNPRVVQGALVSGDMAAANTSAPGVIQYAVVGTKVLNGSGVIATITFDRIGDSAGSLTVNGSVINVNGAKVTAGFAGWTDPGPTAPVAEVPAPTIPGGTGGSGGSGGSGPYVVGGTLTMPSDDAAARERKEAPAQQTPQEPRESAAAAPPPSEAPAVPEAPPAAKKAQEPFKPVQSVLEKFRLFTGEKTPQNLVALFDRDKAAFFRQTPPICIADGKASVKVLILKVSDDKAPNFAFNSARYVSLIRPGEGEWQIEVRPEKGVTRASISMLTDGAQQEIPLTVTPKVDVDLDKSGKVTEADFLLYLKTRGTENAPKFDLNGDGKRDYQDDYIFTANYLLTVAGKDKREVPAKKTK